MRKKTKMRDLSIQPQEPKDNSHRVKSILAGIAGIALFTLIMWLVQVVIQSAQTTNV